MTHLGRRPDPAQCDELLPLWDAMSHDGRKMVFRATWVEALEETAVHENQQIIEKAPIK